MIASLPMYDWPEIAASTDRFWALVRNGLRGSGIAAPETLTRAGDLFEIWQRPDLVLGQTCGLPYRTRLHGRVTLVATPDFGLPGCPPGYYHSVLVVQAEATEGLPAYWHRRLAINSTDSQSGWGAPQNHAATLGARFTEVLVTGAHVESARAVAEGRAAIAAIDARTWQLIEEWRPEIAGRLRVLARTGPTPGLPFIAATGQDRDALVGALGTAIEALPTADRAALGLRGLAQIPEAAYLAVPTPEAPAQIVRPN